MSELFQSHTGVSGSESTQSSGMGIKDSWDVIAVSVPTCPRLPATIISSQHLQDAYL